MRRALATLAIAAAFAWSSSVTGQQLTPVDNVPPPPPIVSGETFEPDVTIVRQAGQTVREYRVGGQLRAVRVEPDVGPVYYLVDGDGDGQLDTKRHNFAPDFWVNAWVLFSW
jgi:hypothetical protein